MQSSIHYTHLMLSDYYRVLGYCINVPNSTQSAGWCGYTSDLENVSLRVRKGHRRPFLGERSASSQSGEWEGLVEFFIFPYPSLKRNIIIIILYRREVGDVDN